jgi:hypothetical protein
LIRELIAYAIAATPRGSGVLVNVIANESNDAAHGARVVVDDAGTLLPAAARNALVGLEVEPGTFGRPSSVPLFLAAEMAAAQGAQLELGDAPLQLAPAQERTGQVPDARPSERLSVGGGVRVIVSFPR